METRAGKFIKISDLMARTRFWRHFVHFAHERDDEKE
jgi:hypothetical protein